MKKALILVCSLFAALLFTSCFEKETSSSSSGRNKYSSTVIRSTDGSHKVDLVGTWMCKEGSETHMLKFYSNGTFEYNGYLSYAGKTQLSVGSDGEITNKKGFETKGDFSIIDGNILHREYTWEWHNVNGGPSVGETTNKELRPIDNDTFILGGSSTFVLQ